MLSKNNTKNNTEKNVEKMKRLEQQTLSSSDGKEISLKNVVDSRLKIVSGAGPMTRLESKKVLERTIANCKKCPKLYSLDMNEDFPIFCRLGHIKIRTAMHCTRNDSGRWTKKQRKSIMKLRGERHELD